VPAATGPGATPHWVFAALGALLVAAYANAMPLAVAVDAPFLLSNPRVQALTLENLRLIFTKPYWWPVHSDDLFRPVTLLSLLLLPGDAAHPWWLHGVNLVLHALNVWMAFRIAWRVGGSANGAAAVAALFAVHPVGTETVTNIAGRADLLATAAVLGGLLVHAYALEEPRRAAPKRLVLGLLALAGALAKESAVVLLPVLVLYDIARAGARLPWRGALDAAWRRGRGSYAVVVVSFVVMAAVRHQALAGELPHGQPFVDNPLVAASFLESRLTALAVLGRDVGLLLWPASLSADYSYDQIPVFGHGATVSDHAPGLVLIAALLAAAVALAAGRARADRPAAFFWMFFFLGTRVPTANVLTLIGSIRAERFDYLPMLGFFGAIVAWLEPRLAPPRALRVAAGALAAVLAALALRTAVRNRDWRDDEAIWSAAIRVCPDSYKPYKGLARVRLQQGDRGAAEALFEKSVAILDKRPLPAADRSSDLLLAQGELHLTLGDHRRALAVLARAAETDRATNDRVREARLGRGEPAGEVTDVGVLRIHEALGEAAAGAGDLEAARAAFAWYRHLDPTHARPCLRLAEIAARAGRPAEETMLLVEALVLEPDDAELWRRLPGVVAREGIHGLGREGGRLRIDPSDPALAAVVARACPDLVAMLRTAGRAPRAEEAQAICAQNLGYRPH
jgi:tetratricopeptide (TPR) repeat protein